MKKKCKIIQKIVFIILLSLAIPSLYIVGVIRDKNYTCINNKCITFVEYRTGGMDDVFFRIYFQKVFLEVFLSKDTIYVDLPKTETAYLFKELRDGKFIVYGEPFKINGNIDNRIIFKNQYSREIYDYRNSSKKERTFYFIDELSCGFTF